MAVATRRANGAQASADGPDLDEVRMIAALLLPRLHQATRYRLLRELAEQAAALYGPTGTPAPYWISQILGD